MVLLAAVSIQAAADSVRIGQVDTSSLLTRQTVGLYAGVTDSSGRTVERLGTEDFAVFEADEDGVFERIPVLSVTPNATQGTGVSFLLMVDNSGSMYDTIDGTPTRNSDATRITAAKEAIGTFIDSMTNPKDRLGLSSFNTRYGREVPLTADRIRVSSSLGGIIKPEAEDAYTELYAALFTASGDLAGTPGRRAIIVLSDGENYPYFERKGIPHPVHGERTFTHAESILELQREGISVFAINFGREKDRNLVEIAHQTGGLVFDAANRDELASVYGEIKERVLDEYLIEARGLVHATDSARVRVEYVSGRTPAAAERTYYASNLFGVPAERLGLMFLIPFLFALLAWWLLSLIRAGRQSAVPNLMVLDSGRGTASTRMFDLNKDVTVIGGSPKDDLTISGSPTVTESHATVVFDRKTGSYTVAGDAAVTVNNRPVKKKTLKAGDVIRIGDSTIVFDDDVTKASK